jgi:uncharacterized membrane protein YeiH
MPPDEFPTERLHFDLPLSFSLLAYFTFGITGALAGMRRGYDFIGIVFLAMIAAGGGGLIRDGLLLSSGPATVLSDSRNMVVVVASALVAYLFHVQVDRFGRVIAVIDALGLGAFAVLGVQRTLAAGLGVPAAILGGTMTAVGGGLLRDVLVREEPLLFKPGQFYALVAIGGCCLYLSLMRWTVLADDEAAVATIITVFVVRMLAIRFNWRTRAVLQEPPQSS